MPQSQRRAIVFASVALVSGPLLALSWRVRGVEPATQSSPATQAGRSEVARLRDGARLAPIMQMRQATAEASIDDAARQAILDVLDRTREKLLDRVATLSRDPRALEDRITDLQGSLSQLSKELTDVARPHQDAVRPYLRHVFTEVKALGEEKALVLAALETLELTDEQRAKVDAQLDRLGTELQESRKETEIPEDEKRTVALLRARTEIRDVLSEEQRGKRDKWLDDRNAAEQPKVTGRIRAAAPPPPPAPPGRPKAPGPR